MIGRWQCLPPHEGHLGLIRMVLREGNKVCIALRKEDGTDKNPYTQKERREAFRKIFGEEIRKGKIRIINIPDVKEVIHGRDVGWGIREIRLDKETEAISATEVRKKKCN